MWGYLPRHLPCAQRRLYLSVMETGIRAGRTLRPCDNIQGGIIQGSLSLHRWIKGGKTLTGMKEQSRKTGENLILFSGDLLEAVVEASELGGVEYLSGRG